MKEKSPAFQWYPKQYLGDDRVLAMDWDARGMHVHLLNLSWQQEPVGSIPDDMGLLRRWLGLPSGFADADRVWARVWPQIKAAWALTDGRWFNAGMVKSWERQQTYKQNGSKKKAKREQLYEYEEEDLNQKKSNSKEEPPFDSDVTIQKIAQLHPKFAKPFETERAIVEQLDRLGDELGVRNALDYLLSQTKKYREHWEKWPDEDKKHSPESPRWYSSGCYREPEKAWAAKAAVITGGANGNGNSKDATRNAGNRTAIIQGITGRSPGRDAVPVRPATSERNNARDVQTVESSAD